MLKDCKRGIVVCVLPLSPGHVQDWFRSDGNCSNRANRRCGGMEVTSKIALFVQNSL